MFNSTHNTGEAVDAVASDVAHFEEGRAALDRSKDELAREFRKLIGEGEALLNASASLSGESLVLAREQFRVGLAEAKSSIDALSTTAQENGRRAAVAADEYVRANPWPVVGMAAGLGFVIGAMAIRR